MDTTKTKENLKEIIETGKINDIEFCNKLPELLVYSDDEIVTLTLQVVAELSKCEVERNKYANKEIAHNVLDLIDKYSIKNIELLKQCCRVLGNICCDCDDGRNAIIESNGVPTLKKLYESLVINKNVVVTNELHLFAFKMMLNFCLGGPNMTRAVIENGFIDTIYDLLNFEFSKDNGNDDVLSLGMLILSVLNENTPDLVFDNRINKLILCILKESVYVDLSETCLDHFQMQTEHDSVKTLLAKEGAVEVLCSRLENLVSKYQSGEMSPDDDDVKSLVKQACELIIIILTGDEAMNILYNNGVGETYLTIIKWLDSSDYNLLSTSVLAVGNFARSDTYCKQMMENGIYEKLLDLFETYYKFSQQMNENINTKYPIDISTVTQVQHAILSALRNLSVPKENKRIASVNGKAAPLLLRALPDVKHPNVAYKMLATLRMLVDGQESVAKMIINNENALKAINKWGAQVEHSGAGGESPRLLAWAVKHYNGGRSKILELDGCITCLVNMLVASHPVMQNESILSLTLIAIEAINKDEQTEINLIQQLLKSEIGKHISVLIDTNLAKMPIEVAENLMAFLDVTVKNVNIKTDFKAANIHESLIKFVDCRDDFTDDLKNAISNVISLVEN